MALPFEMGCKLQLVTRYSDQFSKVRSIYIH